MNRIPNSLRVARLGYSPSFNFVHMACLKSSLFSHFCKLLLLYLFSSFTIFFSFVSKLYSIFICFQILYSFVFKLFFLLICFQTLFYIHLFSNPISICFHFLFLFICFQTLLFYLFILKPLIFIYNHLFFFLNAKLNLSRPIG